MEKTTETKPMDFLCKILWDLSNLDESIVSHPEIVGIRYQIAEYVGLIDNSQQLSEDFDDQNSECDNFCGCSLGMDPMTECPTCS